MLYLRIPAVEGFDSKQQEFVQLKPPVVLQLEHSLIAISKWEAKYHKPFLSMGSRTKEEGLYYIKCMTVNKNVPSDVYSRLTQKHLRTIKAYMEDPHSATTIRVDKKARRNGTQTSEEIYYSMFYYGIPIDCAKWHIHNLMAVLDVANRHNTPVKKKTAAELNRYYAELNAQRCAEWGTSG